MTTTPPGWYDDGHGAMRWWDGSQWTEHVAQPDPEPSPDAPTEAEIVAASEADGSVEPAAVPADGIPAASADAADAGHPVAQPGAAPSAASWSSPQPGYGAPVAGAPAPAAPYGGPDASSGAFVAATDPRKSRLWILWVVLGVVLLGIVIAAAVVVPLLLLNAATSGAGVDSDDERAAVAAVELYDDAWQEADCDAFTRSTTEQFRETSGFGDCDSFVAEAQAFDENFDDYEISIGNVVTEEGSIRVTTTESFAALLDDQGQPVATPTPGSAVYHYVLVPTDGGWAIDELTFEE